MASGSNSTSIAGQGISSTYQYSLSVSYASGTQSIENNQTYIEARCTLSGQYIGWTGTNVTLQLYWHDNKNGDQLLNSGTWSSGGMGYGTREVFGSKWVKHQDNGTLDGCYAWVHVQASSGTYAPNSLQSLVTGGDRSFSTIPRTTSMSISATSRNLGESITITGSGASSSFTHKLYVLWNGSWIGINTSLGSSVNQSYTIPKSWANNLPNGTSGTATFSLDTYSGSTKIGNSQKSCTIYVPNTTEFNPSISSIAVSEANSSVATQFGFYVQNQSKLKFVNTCSGAYSSSINSIKTTINGTTYSGNTITTNAISASGTVSYTVTATDTRGRSVSKTGSVSVTAYSTPTLSGSAYRCNSSYTRDDNDGTYGQTTYSYNVVALSNKNTLTFTIDYRVSGGSWTNLKTISSGYSASNATFNMGNVLTATNTYEVRLGIKDFFSSTSYYVMTVSPTYTLINFGAGGKSIAFGQQSSNNGTMEINMPVVVKNMIASVKFATQFRCGMYHLSGNGTTDTYIRLATFTITGTYADKPIGVWINQRSTRAITLLSIRFSTSSGTDPSLATLRHIGNSYGLYMCKVSTSTWYLVAKKGQQWEDIEILDIYVSGSMGLTITIDSTSVQYTSLPSTTYMQSVHQYQGEDNVMVVV